MDFEYVYGPEIYGFKISYGTPMERLLWNISYGMSPMEFLLWNILNLSPMEFLKFWLDLIKKFEMLKHGVYPSFISSAFPEISGS